MTTPPVAGIVFNTDDDALARLPLEEVRITALVVDLSARVDVVQTFFNPSKTSTSRAKYMFPVPSGAAVCAFDMYSEISGHLIVGVAKEKVQAAQEHEQAIQEGKRAALVEWGSGDIFTISVGAIPARDRVRTTVTYVMDLLDGDVSYEIRLQIPMSVGQRYGDPPMGMRGAAAASTRTRMRIDTNVQMRGKITNIESPSHPGIHAASYKSRTGERSQRRATIAYRSPDFLEQDFVLCIQADKIDRPRCFAELDPRGSGTVAMQLALLPKFDLPPIPSQEFIFVVDRSGSMAGMRIETAKDTMAMLLRFLPGDGTTFNIFSFGSHCDSLWGRSALYSSSTMLEATQHIDGMAANYGGTEIRTALQQVCNSRDRSRPAVVFILTDGESYDHDATAGVIASAVQQSSPGSPLRVFALGIGDTASSEMCERIAHAGNGFARYATTAEDIVSKCATLFRAGRSFLLQDISIDWGLPPAKFQSTSSPVASSNANAFAQQTPIHPEPLYAGHRYTVFALIRNKRYKIPKTITMSAKRDGEPDALTFTIPVEKVRFTDNNGHRLIHTLAARRLIRDLQNDVELAQILSEEERKTHIVELGEKYQLASKYTSFVAVEDDGETPLPVPRPAWAKPPRRKNKASRSSQTARSPGVLGYVRSTLAFGGVFVTEFLRTWFGPGSSAQPAQPSNTPDAGGGDEPDEDEDGDAFDNARNYDSDDTFSTLSSFFSYSDSSATDSRPPTPLDDNARSPSPDLDADPNSAGPQGQNDDTQLMRAFAPPLTQDVKQLIRLQSPEGAFIVDDTFRQIVGLEAIAKRPSHVDDSLWATALAIAYCRKHLAQQPDILGILDEKAREWVEKHSQGVTGSRVDFNALVSQASVALGT